MVITQNNLALLLTHKKKTKQRLKVITKMTEQLLSNLHYFSDINVSFSVPVDK